jgi:predicted site-specific integrase-resolvase
VADDRDEPLISSGDVARRLGVATGTISRWVRDGTLVPAFITPGGRSRFLWSQVQAQLRERRDADG